MKKRSPIAVFFFGFITVFIYSWYWLVKTKGEMNSLGQKIPTAWIWLIPFFGGLYWLWKYSVAVENVTNGKFNKVLAFIVSWFLGSIGYAIIQDSFNSVSAASAGSMGAATMPAQDPNTATQMPVTQTDPMLQQAQPATLESASEPSPTNEMPMSQSPTEAPMMQPPQEQAPMATNNEQPMTQPQDPNQPMQPIQPSSDQMPPQAPQGPTIVSG